MNRWRVVVGGVSMNLALGSLYAWSVFVLPLEKEFRWTRAQTSWVYTIAVVTFASTFVLAGRIQDRRGPRPCALAGALLVSVGFFAASFTASLWFLYLAFGIIVGAGNGFGYATPMPVASKSTWVGCRTDGRRVRRRIGDFRTDRVELDYVDRLAIDVSATWARVRCHGFDRRMAAREPTARISAGWVDAGGCGDGGA
jgi:hypothetical protein